MEFMQNLLSMVFITGIFTLNDKQKQKNEALKGISDRCWNSKSRKCNKEALFSTITDVTRLCEALVHWSNVKTNEKFQIQHFYNLPGTQVLNICKVLKTGSWIAWTIFQRTCYWKYLCVLVLVLTRIIQWGSVRYRSWLLEIHFCQLSDG